MGIIHTAKRQFRTLTAGFLAALSVAITYGMPALGAAYTPDFLVGSAASPAKRIGFDLEQEGDLRDALISDLADIDVAEIHALRTFFQHASASFPATPLVYRYVLAYPGSFTKSDFDDIKNMFNGVFLGQLPGNRYGVKPLLLPKGSVVFHVRSQHRRNILGEYNPALINMHLASALNHKHWEALFWRQYASGSMPETELLGEVVSSLSDLLHVQKALNDRYKNGWVIKQVGESNSGLDVITSDVDLAAEVTKYLASDFEDFRRKKLAEWDERGADIDYVIADLKDHAGFIGWKVHTILSKPFDAIVQRRAAIDKEYRVEVIAGRVLGDGSTVDRHAWEVEERTGRAPDISSANEIANVEAYAQSLVDQLPLELRGMTFAMDIARLKQGGYMLIESNPGGGSGFLYSKTESVAALNRFLLRYPELVRQQRVAAKGLASSEQMATLKRWLKEWNITKFPAWLEIFPDRVEFVEMKPKAVRACSRPSSFR